MEEYRDTTEILQELKQLYSDGLITEKEYEIKRREVLGIEIPTNQLTQTNDIEQIPQSNANRKSIQIPLPNLPVFYEVVLRSDSVRIPNCCPVCLNTDNLTEVSLSAKDNGMTISPSGYRRKTISTYKHSVNIPFYVCSEHINTWKKYVKLSFNNKTKLFFANKQYAEIFAKMNELEIKEVNNLAVAGNHALKVGRKIGEGVLDILGSIF